MTIPNATTATRPTSREAKRDTGRRRAFGPCSVLTREGWCRGCENDRATDLPPRHRLDVAEAS